uniref:Transmembrane domain protein n=1 Tax=Thermococcus prieurii TaxID=1128108 RepID=R4LD78_9EURY|nr:transmembrane domain protein [Thermococcus prieurii]
MWRSFFTCFPCKSASLPFLPLLWLRFSSPSPLPPREKSPLIGINERKKPVMSDFLCFQNKNVVILKIPIIGHFLFLFLVDSNQSWRNALFSFVFRILACVNSLLLTSLVMSDFLRFQNSEF